MQFKCNKGVLGNNSLHFNIVDNFCTVKSGSAAESIGGVATASVGVCGACSTGGATASVGGEFTGGATVSVGGYVAKSIGVCSKSIDGVTTCCF